MASTIGKVRAVFTASTSGLTAGVNSASGSMRRLQADVAGLRSGMGSLNAIQGAQLFGSVVSGATSAARSLISMGAASAQAISASSDLAQRLGLTYGELAGLSNAADQFGVSEEQLGGAMTRLQVAFAKAAGGSAQATAAFQRIGLSVADLNGMTANEQFEAIAEAISKLPTEAERAAAAVSLFGRSGAALAPMFAQGAAVLRAASEEADKFGLKLNNAQASDVKTMFNSFKDVQDVIQGVINQVTAYLAPAVTAITTAFTDFVGSVGGANIGQAIGEGILQGARFFAQIADYFVEQSSTIWEYASQIGGQWNAVWEVGQRIADYFSGVGRFWEAVFKGVASLIAGMAGRLLTAAGKLAGSIPGWGGVGDQLKAAGRSLTQSSKEMWTDAGGALKKAGENMNNALFGRNDAEKAGEAIAGPWTKTIDQAIAAARDAADNVDVATKQEVDINQVVEVKGIKEAVQGIDSRSSEGLKEMFRIMRGDTGNNVAEQQLGELRGIRQAIEDQDGGMDADIVEIAAAGAA